MCAIPFAFSACERAAPEVPAGLLTSRQAQEAGSAIFAANCAICHGVRGDGHGLRREGMTPPPANLTLLTWSDPTRASRVYQAIRNGISGTAMTSWPTLSDPEVWNVVSYIYSLRSV